MINVELSMLTIAIRVLDILEVRSG